MFILYFNIIFFCNFLSFFLKINFCPIHRLAHGPWPSFCLCPGKNNAIKIKAIIRSTKKL